MEKTMNKKNVWNQNTEIGIVKKVSIEEITSEI